MVGYRGQVLIPPKGNFVYNFYQSWFGKPDTAQQASSKLDFELEVVRGSILDTSKLMGNLLICCMVTQSMGSADPILLLTIQLSSLFCYSWASSCLHLEKVIVGLYLLYPSE